MWDGSAYPPLLRSEEISFAARLFALVDVWDALIADRPKRRALPAAEVRCHTRKQMGKCFDPEVVRTVLDLDGIAPGKES